MRAPHHPAPPYRAANFTPVQHHADHNPYHPPRAHTQAAAEQTEDTAAGTDYWCTDGKENLYLLTIPKSVIEGDVVDEDGDKMDLEEWLSCKMGFSVEEYGACYNVTDKRTEQIIKATEPAEEPDEVGVG